MADTRCVQALPRARARVRGIGCAASDLMQRRHQRSPGSCGTDGPWPSSSSPLAAAAAAAATVLANSAMGVPLMRGCLSSWLQSQAGGSAGEGQGGARSQWMPVAAESLVFALQEHAVTGSGARAGLACPRNRVSASSAPGWPWWPCRRHCRRCRHHCCRSHRCCAGQPPAGQRRGAGAGATAGGQFSGRERGRAWRRAQRPQGALAQTRQRALVPPPHLAPPHPSHHLMTSSQQCRRPPRWAGHWRAWRWGSHSRRAAPPAGQCRRKSGCLSNCIG